MKFIDIILVLSVSAVASALVATPNAETRSHQLSKRSPGKGWEKLVEDNPNDDDASEPGPSNDGNSVESRLADAKRQREDICDKYRKYKDDLNQDALEYGFVDDVLSNQSSTEQYGDVDSGESFRSRYKKMKRLKQECKSAKRQEKDLRKEFEEQSGTGWRGKLKRLKKMLTKH
ncbi:hypothetical protein BATDEDRAFT_25588 [Batrachochytrium dendrobatidis JAM81]|uniref:Uncharacterized protein n=1 Tax=Batrachochytrium dendrobatidis (strain JAM81 / FGSC 10211) TaxID=684364 RepID=F4P502_BATDJ|nr:uncharacterized protein BATDEDRAFT_25588 [Batrachochytrium dendrobatidis JAM81]EGF80001.1 hypothetical protein BATDEDRAFT_25588 [Batrachochytrium dendrobatidis JAM81]|eukprot:XP_006679483.1 hypothetical protein BATDEDRAFT_25588 [Batrachochytrium dendrobatidis JAM81]